MDESVCSSGEEDLPTALQHVTTDTAAAAQPQLVSSITTTDAMPLYMYSTAV